MNAFSNYLETSIINHMLRGLPYQKPASLYFALFTANPGDSGNDNEVTGPSYARVEMANTKVNFPQCSASGTPTKTNGESILFPTATGVWGTITHWAAYDAPSALTVVGDITNGSGSITGIASTADLRVGMTVTGPGIPAGSVITAKSANSIAISNDATATTNDITVTVAPKMIIHGPLNTKRYVKSGKTPKIQGESITITIPQGPTGGFTDYAQRKILDHVFGHLTYDGPDAVYAGFGTSLSADNLNEWDDGAYSRQSVTFEAPENGISTNTNILSFTGVDGADSGATLTSVGVWDDDNAGNLLVAGELKKSLQVDESNLVKFLAGQLSVTLQ